MLLISFGCNIEFLGQEESNTPVMDKSVWQEETKKADYGDIEYEKEIPKEIDEPIDEVPDTVSNNWDLGFVQAIVFGLAILIVLYILYLIFGNMVFQDKRIDQKNRSFTLEEIEENLETADLDSHLNQSLTAGDYRKAIRLHYLRIIKDLSLKNWIEWQKDKTNFAYVGEMSDRNEFHSFKDLTIAFEIVWYGDAKILKEHFERLDPIFNGFLLNLNRP